MAIELPVNNTRTRCERDGSELRPCRFLDWAMGEVLVGERPRGFRPLTVLNTNTAAVTFYAVVYAPRSRVGIPGTLVLNFCPWCGERITPYQAAREHEETSGHNPGGESDGK